MSMNEPGAALRASVGVDTDELRRGMQEADRVVKNSAQQLGRSAEQAGADVGDRMMRGLLGALAGAVTVHTAIRFGRQVLELGELGEQASDVRRTLANVYGADVQSALGGLRSAVRGQVDDMTLLQQATKARGMGIVADTREAARLFELASQTGQAFGAMGAGQSIDTMLGMAASQGTRQLAQFGVEAERVKARMDALQSSVYGFSREQAYMQAVTEEMGKAAERAGEQGSKYEQTKTASANLRQEVGMLTDEVLENAAGLSLLGSIVGGLGTMLERRRITGEAQAELDALKESARALGFEMPQVITRFSDASNVFVQAQQRATELHAAYANGPMVYDDYRAAMGQVLGGLYELTGIAPPAAAAIDGIGDAAVRNAAQIGQLIGSIQALNAQVLGDLAAVQDFAYARASDPKKLGMAVQGLRGVDNLPEFLAQIEEIERVKGNVVAGMERRSEAVWGYSYHVASDVDKLAMLQAKLANIDPAQEAERYYQVLTQIHDLEKDMARGGGGGSAMADWARQREAELRSAAESVFRASSVTQEDWWRTNLGVYRDAPDEYLRRLRSAVEDPASQWQELLGGRSGDAAQLYLAEQARAWETGQWHLLGEGFDSEASMGAMRQAVLEVIDARRSREAMIAQLMASADLASAGATQRDISEALGFTGLTQGMDLATGLTQGMASAGVGTQLVDMIDEEFRATEETWVMMGFLSMGWMTKGQQQAAPEAARTLAEMMFPHLREMLDSAGWRP